MGIFSELWEAEVDQLQARIDELEARLTNYEQLATAASELRRGCTCRYDDRCANCDRIVLVVDLAKKLLTPAPAEEDKAGDQLKVASAIRELEAIALGIHCHTLFDRLRISADIETNLATIVAALPAK